MHCYITNSQFCHYCIVALVWTTVTLKCPSLPWAITFMHVCTLATKSIYALSAKGKYTNPVVSSCFYHILLYDSIEIRKSYLFIYKLKMNTLWEHT